MSFSPRTLRRGLREGVYTAESPRIYRNYPEPPEEWPEWRRARLRVAIRAAMKFLQGDEWQEIMRGLERDGMLKKGRETKRGPLVSKQRAYQYIAVGCDFLVQRGCFVDVRLEKKNNAKP